MSYHTKYDVDGCLEHQLRIFLARAFIRFARKDRIAVISLRDAVARVEAGLIDADLGAGVIKQRVARRGAGKSGGYRTILFFRSDVRAVFVYGFAKSRKANLTPDEVATFKTAAKIVLALSDDAMDEEVETGRMREIEPDAEDL